MRTIDDIRNEFLNLKAPFVWSLKLSAGEFEALRSYIRDNHGLEDYPLVMIFVAEWYKRCYDINTSITSEMPWLNAEAVWRGCGFRGYNQWVYSSERGKEWLYSMYVLGGMSAKLECGHPEDHLLEQLCRLYHGEDVTLSAAGTRAIALAKSIENGGSLFYFIQEIINGRFPYSIEDIENKSGDIYGLIKLLQNANRRALRDKFSCEWLINYANFYETMSRRLKLGLKPERGANGERQYLSYERLESWKFDHPETIARIKISLRFLCDSEIIKDTDFDNPVLTYSNTGNDEVGFLAWNNKDAAISDKIPNRYFTSVEVVVQITRVDGSTEEHPVAANADFPDFLQVYKVANRIAEWSSRQRNSATAVVYNKSCKIIAPPDVEVIEKPFYLNVTEENEPKESEDYCWTDIEDSVIIQDRIGNELKLYNRSGGYEISIRRYEAVIAYHNAGTVSYRFRGNIDDEWQTEEIPILFGTDSIEIRRYQPNSDDYEIIAPEKITYRQQDQSVVDIESLKEGVTHITILLQGKERKLKVWYVPYGGPDAPIVRDFRNKCIRWFDGTEINPVSDELTVDVNRGDDFNQVIVPIYAPIEGHEIWIDNELAERLPLQHNVQIPFLNCEHFTVKTIDDSGIHTMTGDQLHDLYYQAPDQGLGEKCQLATVKKGNLTMYLFNPADKTEKIEVAGGVKLPIYSVRHPRHYGKPDIPVSTPFKPIKPISLTEAFQTTVDNNTYFFVFRDLKLGVKKESLIKDLFIPLAQSGQLNNATYIQLWRLAFEFHFDWLLLPRQQWEEVPEKYRPQIIELFLSTPKATNEYERRQLEIFLADYWIFNDFTTDDKVGAKALKMILGTAANTPATRHSTMKEFIEEFDKSTVKFHEMTKIIKI